MTFRRRVVNPDHTPRKIASLDVSARADLDLSGFPPEVQAETLDAARRFWSASPRDDDETKEKARP